MEAQTDSQTYDSTAPQPQLTGKQPSTQLHQPSASRRIQGIEYLIVAFLALIALIPRIVLGSQLDMVTDEIIYIISGKLYLPLLEHGSMHASGWQYNYEHPPLVKLLIGFSVALNTSWGHPLGELLAARIPSIVSGTLLILALYWLGRKPFGRFIALMAALCLAVSPWLAYFSALAYLDMTMTALITVAYLLLWFAMRQPRYYLLVALLVGLAVACKYTAALAIPGMLLFTAYYFLALRPRLPQEQQGRLPIFWWLCALLLAPLVFLASDPAIWTHPLSLLIHSFHYEWSHSYNGHLTFIAGQANLHIAQWAVLFIILSKLSIFITIPAIVFVILACAYLLRFHRGKQHTQVTEATSRAFLLIWLITILGMFSLLNIVVGTHYLLPIAPPMAFAGAYGLMLLARTLNRPILSLCTLADPRRDNPLRLSGLVDTGQLSFDTIRRRSIIRVVLLALVVLPHLIGLVTIYGAEGYTSEFFQSENTTLQVAYPGYREATWWLAEHTRGQVSVGLVALPETLSHGDPTVSWFRYNSNLPRRLKLTEAHLDSYNTTYDYLVWPMHLVQRGYALPTGWHIAQTIMGGKTIYCYILARN